MIKRISSSFLAILMLICFVLSVPAVGGFAAADGTGYYTITSSNGVNMRSGPSTSYSKVGSVPLNALINVTEVSGVWGKTTYNGITGWVSLDYAKKTTVSGNASHQKILSGLDTLRAKFPDGKYWNHYGSSQKNLDGWTNTPCPDGHYLNGVQQCNGQCDGFARKLGLDLFGLSTDSWEQRNNTLEGLCVGDIIRYRSRHTVMVTGFTEDKDYLIVTDCNWDYHCGISWDRYFSISRYIQEGPFYVLHYPGNTFTKEVYLAEASPEIHLDYTQLTLCEGYSYKMGYTTENVKSEIYWDSSDPMVASVDNNGVITGVSPGTATIYAYYADIEVECTVTVTKNMEIERLQGSNRISTAIAIAKEGWGASAKNVILANAYSFADALAGVPLSKKLDAPILLTGNLATGLEADLVSQLKSLNTKNIFILGGSGVVSEKIEKSLGDSGYNVERVFGANRFGTAVEIAKLLDNPSNKAFAVTALDYPDALSVGTVAAMLDAPILYVNKNGTLDSLTSAYISSESIKNVDVIGGVGVIADAVTSNLKKYGVTSVTRLSGNDRFSTCIAVNNKYLSTFTGKSIALATGYAYPDALAGGALAAKLGVPIMLADRSASLNAETTTFLRSFKPSKIYVFGGVGAVKEPIVYKYTNF